MNKEPSNDTTAELTERADTNYPTSSRTWEVARIFLGVMYLLGGLFHLYLGVQSPELYIEFADMALLDFYTTLWRALVVPYLAILQPLIALFEFGVGLALLWRGPLPRIGHVSGASFQFLLVLSGPWGGINALIAFVHLAAYRVIYPKSVFGHIRQRISRGVSE